MLKFLRRFLKEEDDEQVQLREKFTYFRRLLEHNNTALATMADMEEKLSGDFLFDTGYLQSQIGQLEENVGGMVGELNRLTRNAYRDLNPVFTHLCQEIQQELAAPAAIPDTPYILPLNALGREMAPSVGAKMANLGEMRYRLHLPTPGGFAITAAAYKRFLEASGLSQTLEDTLAQADINDLERLEAVSQVLQHQVQQTPLPTDLAAALEAAARNLSHPWVAVRSSAVGEDTEYSFAGQFATLLNVAATDLADHYKAIVASKFTSRAIFYWKFHNFSVSQLPMAVGVVEMIPARASGVMFSVDPLAPAEEKVIISAVWGLGQFAVDGTVSPDVYALARRPPHDIHNRRLGDKHAALHCLPAGGTAAQAVPSEAREAPCLTDPEARRLAELALLLEAHFDGPQDIEWAMDPQGQILLLQCRPLRVTGTAFAGGEREAPKETGPPLIDAGVRAVGGTAAGPVFMVQREADIPGIPAGAVVVARQPIARLVTVMDRIAAIITKVGSPTDHMTILAREFRIPTLVDVGPSLDRLEPEQIITVDADHARIYAGRVEDLLKAQVPLDDLWRTDKMHQLLRRCLRNISPLHLLDPASPEFAPESCRSLHDITRFCHEKAMDAMFQLDVEESARSRGVCRLDSPLPLNLFILDLGRGLVVHGKPMVKEEDILCKPFQAILRGFHHPAVRWSGQVAVDLKGFMSVFANTLYDMGKADTGLGGKSFAIITDCYLNFNSRLGYHFGMLDAYLTPERNDNYISFQFKGGAANLERRERRARLLALILEDLGFKAQAVGDMVRGRLVKFSQADTEDILKTVGTLLAFSRQLDLALASDAIMERIWQAFKEKDYGLLFVSAEPASS